MSQNAGAIGISVTITGQNFGTAKGTSIVTFNGVSAGTATAWSATSITVNVPANATSGEVIVNVNGRLSNGFPFTVTSTPPNSCATGMIPCQLVGTISGPWIPLVPVTAAGGPQNTTTADTNFDGEYDFFPIAYGLYTVTPTLPGYTFSPVSASISIDEPLVTQNFVETPVLASYTISGTITYAGAKSGTAYIRVYSSDCVAVSCTVVAGTSFVQGTLLTGAEYVVRGLEPAGNGGSGNAGSYVVEVEIDTLGTGVPNASNPEGMSSPVTITTANQNGVNIVVSDRTPGTAPAAPSDLIVSPGPNMAVVQYHPSLNGNGEEAATSYKVYLGTDPNASNGIPVVFPAQGANRSVLDSSNLFIMKNIVNQPTYFKVSALNSSGESAPSSVVGPVAIGPTSGANTVSGTVTFPGTATGPLYAGVYNVATNVFYIEEIAQSVSPQKYSVSGVPSGTYRNLALVDMNNDGEIDISDLDNIRVNLNDPIQVSTDVTGNISLTNAGATAIVTTNHDRLIGNLDSYSLHLGISSGAQLPISVVLFSGPNIPVPLDMSADSGNLVTTPTFPNGAAPQAGDTYLFEMSGPTGQLNPGEVSASVTSVLNSFAQNLAMQATSPGSSTVPLLTWSAPSSRPSSYTYSVSVRQAGGGLIWSYSGGQSNGIANSQTSVLYNVDGSASIAALNPGTTYDWDVQVKDAAGNTALIQTTYTP